MDIYEAMNCFKEKAFPFLIKKEPLQRSEIIHPHIHDVIELIFVERGKAAHDLGGITYELSAGDMFIIEPNTYHSYIGSTECDTVIYTVLFHHNLLENELYSLCDIPAMNNVTYFFPLLRKNSAFHPYLAIPDPYISLIQSSLDIMLHEFQIQDIGSKMIIKTRLIECLIMFSRLFRLQEEQTTLTYSDNDPVINDVKTYLTQHYDQSISLEQLSRIYGMSISSLTTKFKAASGKTLLEYKHDIQIREACKLLVNKNYKIVDAAHKVGFNDLSFFYQVFHKKVGLTPAGYQKKINKQTIS